MSGRENSVTESFRKVLRRYCEATGAVDLSAPTEGWDRMVNADEFFAIDGRYFIIEFKSFAWNVKREDHKPSACELCCALEEVDEARELHVRGHFVSWGLKEPLGPLGVKVDVYQNIVCNEKALPSCECMEGRLASPNVQDGGAFCRDVASFKYGLEADEFKAYLRWLLGHSGEDEAQQSLPIVLYGITYTDGITAQTFHSWQDFNMWAESAISHAKSLGRGSSFEP